MQRSRMQEDCDKTYGENSTLNELGSCVNYSAVTSSLILINSQYILNKVSLNRNTCKTKLYIDQRTNQLEGNYPQISPQSNDSVFTNALFV